MSSLWGKELWVDFGMSGRRQSLLETRDVLHCALEWAHEPVICEMGSNVPVSSQDDIEACFRASIGLDGGGSKGDCARRVLDDKKVVQRKGRLVGEERAWIRKRRSVRR